MNILQALQESRERYEDGEREHIDLPFHRSSIGAPSYGRAGSNLMLRWDEPPRIPYCLTVEDLLADDWEPIP